MFQLLRLQNMPIFEQLQLEEALLRTDNGNWCIINSGSPPSIVMGISGKTEQHVNYPKFNQNPIPIIKRFSGGGTVIVDESTCFVSWICNKKDISLNNPREILEWSEKLYKPVFKDLPLPFSLRENDYVHGDRKFGGNAQYLRKDRWLLHSTLLWDYDPKNMDYLLMPPKMPDYRAKRDHNDFICHLKDYFPNQIDFLGMLTKEVTHRMEMVETDLSIAKRSLSYEHIKTTTLYTKI